MSNVICKLAFSQNQKIQAIKSLRTAISKGGAIFGLKEAKALVDSTEKTSTASGDVYSDPVPVVLTFAQYGHLLMEAVTHNAVYIREPAYYVAPTAIDLTIHA